MGSADQPPLPARPTTVSLTFDDGEVSQFGAGAILAAHGIRGTFYLNTGAIDSREQGAMTWAQVASLAAAGNEIGGHTRDHVHLTPPRPRSTTSGTRSATTAPASSRRATTR